MEILFILLTEVIKHGCIIEMIMYAELYQNIFGINQVLYVDITSYKPSFRLLLGGMTFETAGLTIFSNDSDLQNYILGLLNRCIFDKVSQTLNPTIHTKIKDVQGMPLFIKSKENVDQFVKKIFSFHKLIGVLLKPHGILKPIH